MTRNPIVGGYYTSLMLPSGPVQFKFLTEEDQWEVSENYATVQVDGTTNNVVDVSPMTMLQQVAQLALWVGRQVASKVSALASAALDAVMTIGSAAVAITAVSTSPAKAVLAPVVASSVQSVVSTALRKIVWRPIASYVAAIASSTIYTYWGYVYLALVFSTLTVMYLAILISLQVYEFVCWAKSH